MDTFSPAIFAKMKNKKDLTVDHRILEFLFDLHFDRKLPKGIGVMNPFQQETIREIVTAFYSKFYRDQNSRHLILGINPGRLGAGATGIPFTDTKRLESDCGITYSGYATHEPSSVFVYEMIKAYGGPKKFYGNFYISSVSPLGFVLRNENKEINYNYYDSTSLTKAVTPFAVACLEKQLDFNIRRDVVFVLGTGKNAKFVEQLNEKHRFFQKVVALEHPRYIMQYKSKNLENYITKYLETLSLSLGQ